MIFIGYDEHNRPISVLNAKTKELAYAYWQGAGILPHSHKTLDDFMNLDDTPTGVYPLATMKTVTIRSVSSSIDPDSKIVISVK